MIVVRAWLFWFALLAAALAVIAIGAHLLALMPVWASWLAAATISAVALRWACTTSQEHR